MAVRKEILEKLAALMTAAFGLVAALAWNSVIQNAFIRYVQPRFGEGAQLGALVAYAILVTVVAVVATIWIGRAAAKAAELKFPHLWSREFQQPPPTGGAG